jgi:RES domain-containing protein
VIFRGRAYRGHDPYWSFEPTSGEGARLTGGRFNRKGDATLYLSLDPVTAIMEITQGFTNRLPPITLCEYDVDCADIADLRDEASQASYNVKPSEMACGWLSYQVAGRIAPSQAIATRLRGRGYAGALVPCYVPGAVAKDNNLVLWKWGPDLPHKISVFDPNSRLPKNQLSWERGDTL